MCKVETENNLSYKQINNNNKQIIHIISKFHIIIVYLIPTLDSNILCKHLQDSNGRKKINYSNKTDRLRDEL